MGTGCTFQPPTIKLSLTNRSQARACSAATKELLFCCLHFLVYCSNELTSIDEAYSDRKRVIFFAKERMEASIITYKRREHIAKSLGHEAAETRAYELRMAGRQADRQTPTISRKNCFPFTSRIYSFHLFHFFFGSSPLLDMIRINQWNE